MRAAEIRAAETVGTGAVAATAAVAGVGAIAVNRRSVNRHTPRAVGLSREREMAYIRGDLRRLLIIAGGLFVLMIALLLVID
jgi:hypothetical protein